MSQPEVHFGVIRDQLYSQFRKAMEAEDKDRAELLAEALANHLEKHEGYQGRTADAFATWAKFPRARKDYAQVVAILERYVCGIPHEPRSVYECRMLDLLDEARERLRRYVPERGTCDTCKNSPRLLTRIDTGLLICRTCLRGFTPAEKEYRPSAYERQSIKLAGLTLPTTPTPQAVRLLMDIAYRRQLGLADDASEDEVRAHFAPKPKLFHTKVVGVSHKNSDGTERQAVIQRCYVGETLQLFREPDNPHNSHAVRVCRRTGEQLGYLGDHIVGDGSGIGWSVATDLDAGSEHTVVITSIGGERGRVGVIIHVTIGVPPGR